MPFFVKAASNALKQFPILNSSFCEATESLIYKSYHNISIAMHTPQGLVVPNVKNVDQKSILEIAADLNALQERGAKNALLPEDFANGTFSLSNIGIVSSCQPTCQTHLSTVKLIPDRWHVHPPLHHGAAGGDRRHRQDEAAAAL